MTYYQQPWGRLTVTGRRCRLQVLDPSTAFDLEPELIDRLGDNLAIAVSSPEHVLRATWSKALEDSGYIATAVDHTPEDTAKAAAAGLVRIRDLFVASIIGARIDGKWVKACFERMIFDRLVVDDDLIQDWSSWASADLGPAARWRLMAAQLAQTYGPLWVRSPYSPGKRSPDMGVPLPKSVSKAMQWADALVKMGHVASSHEVLTAWTPTHLMDVVDLAAFQAEHERRTMAAQTQR